MKAKWRQVKQTFYKELFFVGCRGQRRLKDTELRPLPYCRINGIAKQRQCKNRVGIFFCKSVFVHQKRLGLFMRKKVGEQKYVHLIQFASDVLECQPGLALAVIRTALHVLFQNNAGIFRLFVLQRIRVHGS